jgi:hypothetical protein
MNRDRDAWSMSLVLVWLVVALVCAIAHPVF